MHSCFFFISTFYSRTFLHRATTGDIDYIENQCVVEEVDTSCKYEVYEGQDIGYADIQVQASSAKEVRDSVNMQLIWASRLKKSKIRVDITPLHLFNVPVTNTVDCRVIFLSRVE